MNTARPKARHTCKRKKHIREGGEREAKCCGEINIEKKSAARQAAPYRALS